jgi:hypothetical protein
MLLAGNDGVWWIDFGASVNTAISHIDDGWFRREPRRLEKLLLDDVIPAEEREYAALAHSGAVAVISCEIKLVSLPF